MLCGLPGGTGTTITSYAYRAVESSQPGPGFYPYTSSGFSLAPNPPSSAPVWSSDGLPLPSAASGGTRFFEFQTGVSAPQNVVNYNITSFSSVPLPATAWLLLSEFGALGLLRRTRPCQSPSPSEA